MKEAQAIDHDKRMQNCLDMFNFRRKITILVSPGTPTPLTYGFFRPKVLLTPDVLADDDLLHYALLHELAHIQLGDVLWNHLRYFTACFFWHNPQRLLTISNISLICHLWQAKITQALLSI